MRMNGLVVLGLLLAVVSGCSSSSSSTGLDETRVRIRNASSVAYQDVIVGDKSYGDIRPFTLTAYQTWEEAYRYTFVSLTAEGKRLVIQPRDLVGEPPLGPGEFTYVLTLEDDQLGMRVE